MPRPKTIYTDKSGIAWKVAANRLLQYKKNDTDWVTTNYKFNPIRGSIVVNVDLFKKTQQDITF